MLFPGSSVLLSQDRYRIGLLPQVNVNLPLATNWRLNTKVESRPLISAGEWGSQLSDFEYRLTDLSILAARKIGPGQSISGGYLLRSLPGEFRHRLIQQYAFTQTFSAFRLGHRLVSDQTFAPTAPTIIRFRYRLSFELPFNGQSVDPAEFYLKLSHEYLNILQSRTYDLEIRGMPTLGYLISDHSKLELGLDYRIGSFLKDRTRHTGFCVVGWYWRW